MNVLPQKNTTSKYRGVCFNKRCGKWSAQHNKSENGMTRLLHIGYFDKEEHAAIAYNHFVYRSPFIDKQFQYFNKVEEEIDPGDLLTIHKTVDDKIKHHFG